VITYNKLFILVSATCILLASCRLDDSIVPVPNPNFNAGGTVLGINVFNRTVNDDYLSHTWTVNSTVKQYYDNNDVVISGVSVPNRFSTAALDDSNKSFIYTNGIFLDPNESATGIYRLYTTDNVLYIELGTNVFYGNLNSKTRITNLTTRAMTWITINNNTVMVNGVPAREAYQVIFSR
jgi:hypothetical protein